MINIDELEIMAEKKQNENLRFRSFLKNHADEEVLDEQFKKLHEKYFAMYDCSKCRNCCQKLGVLIKPDEIDKLNLSKEDMSLLKEEYNGFVNKNDGCPFLCSNKECKLKDNLPVSCREYPYTNKDERLQSLYTIIGNTFVCPAVYEIMEELKKMYNFEKVR